MAKNKKPTLMEVKTVINNMLMHMTELQQNVSKIDSAVSGYIKFKGDEKKYIQWLNKQIEKQKKERKENDSKS